MELIKQVTTWIITWATTYYHSKSQHFITSLSQCILCQGKCQNLPLICQYCCADLPYISSSAKKQSSQEYSHESLLLSPKVSSNISHKNIDDLYCLTTYQWPLNTWLNQLKYQHKFELAKLIANIINRHFESLLETLKSEQYVIIAMPIHITRWQERGFNQSHLIARQLANLSGITYQPDLIVRHKKTESQVGKDGAARRKNIKGAFKVVNLEGLPDHIIIVDDVVTTGTSGNELAHLLKKSGVLKVTLLTAAIALKI